MARPQLTMNRHMDRNNPYLAQWYARAGVPLNRPTEDSNNLRNALNNYGYHLRNRKNIAAKRPNQI